MKNKNLYFKIELLIFKFLFKNNNGQKVLMATEEYYNSGGKLLENFSSTISYTFFKENGIIGKEINIKKNTGIYFIFFNFINIDDLEYLTLCDRRITEKSLKEENTQKAYKIYKKLINVCKYEIIMYYNDFLHCLNLDYTFCQIL